MTKIQHIINFIKESPNGRKFGEIQRFICTLNNKDYDEMALVNSWMVKNHGAKPRYARRYRGYYCNYLLGGQFTGEGALSKQGCTKVNGRWVLNNA